MFLFGQNDYMFCDNLLEEALPYYNIEDTLLIIDNPTMFTKWENELLLGVGRTIVLVYKKDFKWYSAHIMLTYEKNKYVWYQSVPVMFSSNLQDQVLPSLIDSIVSTTYDMIEHNKTKKQHSGRNIHVFVKINSEIVETHFQPDGNQDITALYGSQFTPIYTVFSLGLCNSMSLHYPIRKVCTYGSENENNEKSFFHRIFRRK